MSQSYNPSDALLRHWFGLFPGRSPLLGESFIYFLFLQVLRCFSSLRTPRVYTVLGLQPSGFPHSDISGSLPVCKSPELFAAYHVLLHFRKPRHPPFALALFLVLVNLIRLFTVSYYSLPYEIAVPILATRKNSNFLNIRLNLFTSLPRYLSQYCQ